MTRYPFSPELLDALPEPLAERFRALEVRLLEEICSRLTAAGELNEVTIQSIRALRAQGISLDEIEQAIAETAGIASAELDKLMDDVVSRNAAYYGELASLADVTLPDALVDAADIDAIRRQTQETMSNITGTLGFTVRRRGTAAELLPPAEAFRWTLDQAELAVTSGAVSYDAAIRSAVKELADSGIRTVRYEKDGKVRYDHADVAVRRAVMTGVNQTCQQYAVQSMEYLETDLVEVSAHKGARNIGQGPQNHAAWQGKVYRMGSSRGRYRGLEEATGYGTVQGLGGANCRHHFHPFVDGVSERTYTDKQLQELDNPPFTYEGRTYDQYAASQRHREIERTIRKYKREEAAYQAAGLKEDAGLVRSKRRRLEKEYAAFSKAADLPTQPERLSVLTSANNRGRIPSKAVSGALNPASDAAQKHAVQYYDSVRRMKTDVKQIAKHTGFSAKEIRAVKQFLFQEEHVLSDGKKARFDPSFEIAQSWQRLIEGKAIQPHDITLLRHELMERSLMQQGYRQEDAHIAASQEHNYAKEATAYHDQIEEPSQN